MTQKILKNYIFPVSFSVKGVILEFIFVILHLKIKNECDYAPTERKSDLHRWFLGK